MTEAGEIYTKASLDMFKQAFAGAKRGDSFTYDGFKALYKLIKEESALMNEPYLLDVVEIDTTYAEYTTIDVYNEENGTNYTFWRDVPVFGSYVTGTEGAICYVD